MFNPFYRNPDKSQAHILVLYRNFKNHTPSSHAGLGVNGFHTVTALREAGVQADLEGIWTYKDICKLLEGKYKNITHCLIEAVWLSEQQCADLSYHFPKIEFIVRLHSAPSFIVVEPQAIEITRKMLVLQDSVLNFRVAANSMKMVDFLEKAYRSHCLYLPNLYELPNLKIKSKNCNKDTLKIMSGGAVRLQKGHGISAASSLVLAQKMGKNLEFHLTTTRQEGNGSGSIVQAIRNMFNGLRWAKLIENPWMPAAEFRNLASEMDLGLQLSASETFNIVSANFAAGGVPVIGGPSIEWLPDICQADIDDVSDVTKRAQLLLDSGDGGKMCFKALQKYETKALKTWLNYLNNKPNKKQRWLIFS